MDGDDVQLLTFSPSVAVRRGGSQREAQRVGRSVPDRRNQGSAKPPPWVCVGFRKNFLGEGFLC
jgi:hypothetical protein